MRCRCSCCSYTRNTLSSSIVSASVVLLWPFCPVFLRAQTKERKNTHTYTARLLHGFLSFSFRVSIKTRGSRSLPRRYLVESTEGGEVENCNGHAPPWLGRFNTSPGTLYSAHWTRCTDGVRRTCRTNYITDSTTSSRHRRRRRRRRRRRCASWVTSELQLTHVSATHSLTTSTNCDRHTSPLSIPSYYLGALRSCLSLRVPVSHRKSAERRTAERSRAGWFSSLLKIHVTQAWRRPLIRFDLLNCINRGAGLDASFSFAVFPARVPATRRGSGTATAAARLIQVRRNTTTYLTETWPHSVNHQFYNSIACHRQSFFHYFIYIRGNAPCNSFGGRSR